MAERVAGKVALITGGASGLGAESGRRLAREGAKVVLTDLNLEAAQAVADEILSEGHEARALAHDVTDEARWAEIVAEVLTRHGRLDVLVNSAGVGGGEPILEATLEGWRRVTGINLDGTFLGIRHAAPAMVAAGRGSIINLSSILGKVGMPGAAAYCASKGGVALLTKGDDVLLASRKGKAIRFPADDVREFSGTSGSGVRGMRLTADDEVISLSILHRVGTSAEEREEYLRYAAWKPEKDGEMADQARFIEMAEREQFILTVCANGYGKLSSAYEYRRTGRGGQGITNIDNIARNGAVVASFAATKVDQLMLVTNQAKLIRIGLDSLRVIGRNSAGVRLFDVADGESVVSAVRIDEDPEPENEAEEAIADEMASLAEPEAGESDGEPEA